MSIEYDIDDTIAGLINDLDAVFGVTTTTEDRKEITLNTKKIASAMEASRTESTTKSK